MKNPSRRTVVKGLLAAGPAAALASCSSSKAPDHGQLGKIYNMAAQRDELSRNPIIAIPGILGSYLKDETTDEQVWGVIGGGYDTKYTEQLAFPMAEGKSLAELKDNTVPDGVLSQITLSIGARISVQAYAQMLEALGAGGYVDQTISEASKLKKSSRLNKNEDVDYGKDHYTCFQFDYDWRRSSAENAVKLLGAFIAEKRAYVEDQHVKRFGTKGDVKFDIVAHSMGGLSRPLFPDVRHRTLASRRQPPAPHLGRRIPDR